MQNISKKQVAGAVTGAGLLIGLFGTAATICAEAFLNSSLTSSIRAEFGTKAETISSLDPIIEMMDFGGNPGAGHEAIIEAYNESIRTGTVRSRCPDAASPNCFKEAAAVPPGP